MGYEFNVHRRDDYSDKDYRAAYKAWTESGGQSGTMPRPPKSEEWVVSLPHQCESWEITSYGGSSLGVAIGEMEQFIAEAQEALEELRAGREFVGPESD